MPEIFSNNDCQNEGKGSIEVENEENGPVISLTLRSAYSQSHTQRRIRGDSQRNPCNC